ncbi:MAG: hypothetical protein ACE5H4_05015 [Candidatus Thorarchaeota archaeon]
MSNATKASFILGAIGGFLIALMYTRNILGLTWDGVAWNYQQFLLILILGRILVSIGFIGLWRKSGNVIPLVSAIFIILWVSTYTLLWYLANFTLLLPAGFDPGDFTGIAWISAGVGWITAGISAWLLREKFSAFSIVAALMFLAFGAVMLVIGLLQSLMIPPQLWDYFLRNSWRMICGVNGIVAGIYFLDAART